MVHLQMDPNKNITQNKITKQSKPIGSMGLEYLHTYHSLNFYS